METIGKVVGSRGSGGGFVLMILGEGLTSVSKLRFGLGFLFQA